MPGSSAMVAIDLGNASRLGALLADVRRFWRLRRQQNRDRRLLARFTERELQDLGITRSDVDRELARPFWQYPFP